MHFEQHTELDNLITMQNLCTSANKEGVTTPTTSPSPSQKKTEYAAHAPDMHEDGDEDDKQLVRPALKREPLEEGRDQATDDVDLVPLVPSKPSRPPHATQRQKKKGTTRMARSNCKTGKEV